MAGAPDIEAALLAGLPPLAFAFVLVLARVGSACMLLPVLGEAELPTTVRAGLVVGLVLLLLPVLRPGLPEAPSQPALVLAMVAAEIAAGLWLGWLARLVLLALPFAGQLAALATGLASVLQPDPALGAQTAALGRLFGVAGPVLLLGTGLHALPLQALAGSYAVLPAGRVLPPGPALETVVDAVLGSTSLAVRLAAPFLLASLAWNLAVALVGRLSPSVSWSSLTAPLQMVGALVLLGLLAGGVLAIWRERAGELFAALPGF